MFRTMRRAHQALTPEQCAALLRSETRGVLSVQGDDGYPYAFPINHYYGDDGRLYFHGGNFGHRIDAIRRDPKVCYCVYGQDEKRDGDWAYYVQSVVAFGRARIVEDPEEIVTISRAIAQKFPVPEGYVEKEIEKDARRTLCIALEIEHMSGKLVHEA